MGSIFLSPLREQAAKPSVRNQYALIKFVGYANVKKIWDVSFLAEDIIYCIFECHFFMKISFFILSDLISGCYIK